MSKTHSLGDKDLRLSNILIEWYATFRRDLPWRATKNPYHIWLSEVILQQTRVDQGRSYYDRFVLRFPDIHSLAQADEEEVLKLWQGLGYYSRARNLHATAKDIEQRFNGVFPRRYKDILSLKGVGEYTAAAISSFAYDEAHAVVDGNVYRVLSRIYGIEDAIDSSGGQKVFRAIAAWVLNDENPAQHNQAIMEFGALQCVPVSPDCGSCPASEMCLSYARGEVSKFPIKQGKVKTRDRYFYYFHIRQGDYTYISKREKKDIWQNMYEFPLIELAEPIDEGQILSVDFIRLVVDGLLPQKVEIVHKTKHVLSHQIIYATFIRVGLEEGGALPRYTKIEASCLGDYPVSRLMDKYVIFANKLE